MPPLTRSRLASGVVLLAVLALVADAAAPPDVAPPPRSKPAAGAPLPDGVVARIGRPRLRLPGAVITVAFAPSGMRFVSTGNPPVNSKDTDRVLVEWDAATGEELRQFRGHTDGVQAADYSADGRRLVTCGRDRIVRLWDLTTGQPIREYRGHTAPVLCVAFSPDGKWLASEGQDAVIRVWDADGQAERRGWQGHKSQGTSNLRFSPDGKRLAAVGADFAVRLWDPETGEEKKKLDGPKADCFSLDFSRDGKRLAAIGVEGRLWVWDVETGKAADPIQAHQGIGACVRFSPDGSVLATGGNDGSIRFWDAATGKQLRAAVSAHPGNVSEISFSADGSVLASAGHEGTVRLWDVKTARELPHSGGPVARVALSPDGKRLATAGAEPAVRLWDVETGKELPRVLKADRPPRALGFTSDGRQAVASDTINNLAFWDPDSGTRHRFLQSSVGAATSRMAVGPGGRFIFTSGGGAISLRDTDTLNPVAAGVFEAGVARGGALWGVAFSAADARIAVGNADGRVRVWDTNPWREACVAPVDWQTIQVALATAVAFSPDGRSVAAVSSVDRALRVWEVASGRERVTTTILPSPGYSVAFSPDGRIIATGGTGGHLRLWDAHTGKILAARVAHRAAVTYLAFTPDGRRLVSASADLTLPVAKGNDGLLAGDGTAVVWDVAALVKAVPPVAKPAAADADPLWAALKGADSVKAGDAVWRLAAAPELAVPLLKARLPKLTAGGDPDPKVARLLADLDHDDFGVREKATSDLIAMGPAAAAAVKKAVETTKSREVRRRAEEVLNLIGKVPTLPSLDVVPARAVEVLQRVGTADARALLESWADGPPDAPLTREARLGLALLGKPR
jgi:WD40 repeat protein